MGDELLLVFVRRRLREEGSANWPAIAAACGKPLSVLRKLAYGDRENPRLNTIEPIAIVLGLHAERELRRMAAMPKRKCPLPLRRKIAPRSS
jgi:hypothetical protein